MNKSIFFILLLGMMAAFLSSCRTQTFTVHGEPGTVISVRDQQIATIDQNGQAQITTNRKDGYQFFYLAQAPGSSVKVPFALDYNDCNRVPIHYAGMATNIIGIPTGGLMTIYGAITRNAGLILSGIILMVGLPVGYIAIVGRYGFDSTDYQYDYLKQQATNNDLIR